MRMRWAVFVAATLLWAGSVGCSGDGPDPEEIGDVGGVDDAVSDDGSGDDEASDDTNGADEIPEHCDDGELSGDETDVDCGGSCPPCEIGESCEVRTDCKTAE